MGDSVSDKASAVLEYWFSGDIEVNYKTKWFPTGSAELQRQADDSVRAMFSDLFNSIVNADLESLDEWMSDKRTTLALIIILDQFSRHIYRDLAPDSAERKRADSLALQVAQRLTEPCSWDKSLSVDEFVFSLMPFRHASTLPNLRQVLQETDKRIDSEFKSSELLQKFRKQTIRRLQHLEDREIAEQSCDILEHHEFVADESRIMNEPLLLSTKQFLEERLDRASCKSGSPMSRDVMISLSGGVDSMVIAKIVAVLRPVISIDRVVTVHIDYNNRPESAAEAAYVKQWACNQGFHHRERVITEVRRGVTDRAEYERVSRNIRYGFYKEVLCNDIGNKVGVERCQRRTGVIFGHHVGDIQENVLSNIMRGSSPLDLAGMSAEGTTEGVPVWRPLLSHTKDEIFEFAHKYGVPYFKDTTPSWSTRGKLRKQLIPLLIDMYGSGCLRNISTLAGQSDEVRTLVSENVFDPFFRSVKRFSSGLSVNVCPFYEQTLFFWREVLKGLMHSMSMSMIREKAVNNFLKRIRQGVSEAGRDNFSRGWIELRKGFSSYFTEDGDLIVFKEGVLCPVHDPRDGNKNAVEVLHPKPTVTFDVEGRVVAGNGENSVTSTNMCIGNWTISCTIFRIEVKRSHEIDVKEMVERARHERILQCPSQLLHGTFNYFVAVENDSYEFVVHQSQQRPNYFVPALHGMDWKLRQGLPFLVPNTVCTKQDYEKLIKKGELSIVQLEYNYSPQSGLT